MSIHSARLAGIKMLDMNLKHIMESRKHQTRS